MQTDRWTCGRDTIHAAEPGAAFTLCDRELKPNWWKLRDKYEVDCPACVRELQESEG